MHGKTVVITGATSGIGEVAAEALARLGARVVFMARDAGKAQATLARLIRANPDAAHGWSPAELSTIAGMKSACKAVARKLRRIDVLINNAGAIFERREVTVDGLERTFALNHLAYFVVTACLRPRLAPDARIVSTASNAHVYATLDLEDLQSARRYSTMGMGAYARSKLCNILWTRELARRLADSTITVNCLHPGAVRTGFTGNNSGLLRALFGLGKPFMLSPEEGADTLIYLASSADVAGLSGGYWTRRRLTEPSAAARDPATALQLWEISAGLAGLKV
jgi:NAD(P)-dependent dehydrogenase (short-subunit alcohol dehydrogenase family)